MDYVTAPAKAPKVLDDKEMYVLKPILANYIKAIPLAKKLNHPDKNLKFEWRLDLAGQSVDGMTVYSDSIVEGYIGKGYSVKPFKWNATEVNEDLYTLVASALTQLQGEDFPDYAMNYKGLKFIALASLYKEHLPLCMLYDSFSKIWREPGTRSVDEDSSLMLLNWQIQEWGNHTQYNLRHPEYASYKGNTITLWYGSMSPYDRKELRNNPNAIMVVHRQRNIQLVTCNPELIVDLGEEVRSEDGIFHEINIRQNDLRLMAKAINDLNKDN